MGFLDLFKSKPDNSGVPKVESKKALIQYLKGLSPDDKAINFMINVIERIGSDGYVLFKQGGSGSYAVEYQDLMKFNAISTREIKDHIKRLKEIQSNATSESEKDHLQQQIAEAGGGLAIIWINAASENEYAEKQQLLKNIYEKARNILKN